jgi:hypothetical protein
MMTFAKHAVARMLYSTTSNQQQSPSLTSDFLLELLFVTRATATHIFLLKSAPVAIAKAVSMLRWRFSSGPVGQSCNALNVATL